MFVAERIKNQPSSIGTAQTIRVPMKLRSLIQSNIYKYYAPPELKLLMSTELRILISRTFTYKRVESTLIFIKHKRKSFDLLSKLFLLCFFYLE
jgi:hypothetical protein